MALRLSAYSSDILLHVNNHILFVYLYSGEWNNSCNELQRMLIVRSLRPDRVPYSVTSFIINNLGAK